MAKGIEIGIASETKAFKQGIDAGVIAPLDDAQKALTDLGRDKSLDKLEDNLQEAQKASKNLEKDTKKTADAIESEYKNAYRKLKTESKEGYHKASEAAEGFKDEAKQNFAETASSFDGSMQSIADGVQGTLGGLATSVAGPLGLALGGLGALGGAFAAQWAAAAEKTQERIKAMYDDMLDSGLDYLSKDYVNEQLAALKDDQDQYNGLLKLSKDLGLDLSDVLIAQVTKGEERERVEARIRDKYGEQLDLAGKIEDGFTHTGNEAAVVAGQLGKWKEHFEDLDKDQADTLSTVHDIRDAQEQVNAKYTEQGKLIDANNKKIKETPAEVKVKVAEPDSSKLDAWLRKPKNTRVTVDLVTRDGKKIY